MSNKRELVTEADVRRMAPGARELVLSPDTIATPAALDLAFSRGMRVVYAEAGSASSVPSDLWTRMKASDGTYVVHVENGRAVVTRIAQGRPTPFGEE